MSYLMAHGANRISIRGIIYLCTNLSLLIILFLILFSCTQRSLSPRPSELYVLNGSVLAEKLKKNVLLITATLNGNDESGFGFVVGECHDNLYVVTANHVVRGKSDYPKSTTQQVRVEFCLLNGTFTANLLDRFDKQLDIAVLEVKKPPNYKWIKHHFCYEYLRDEKVWFIGRTKSCWVPSESATGTINKISNRNNEITIDIDGVAKGTSGAPLLTKNGIIGMIKKDDPNELAQAFASQIDKIKEAIEDWGIPWDSECGDVPPKDHNGLPPQPEDFVLIESGTYVMGSSEDEVERNSDEMQHEVTLNSDFYMQETEVTQDQWEAVMKSKPSKFKYCGQNCPVENVSWNDVQEFIRRLNEMDKTNFYRLPTEAEWEYACRAGSESAYEWGNESDCNKMMYENDENYIIRKDNRVIIRYDNCVEVVRQRLLTPDQTAPVKSYKPNAWGLYDMHGNVKEMCQDWYGGYQAGDVTNPVGPTEGKFRVVRGGGWGSLSRTCRSAAREWAHPKNMRSPEIGFRLVMSVE